MTTAATIQVRINGTERAVPSGLTVFTLLEWLDLNPALIVVELDREILNRGAYGNTRLSEGSSLELVHFVGGG